MLKPRLKDVGWLSEKVVIESQSKRKKRQMSKQTFFPSAAALVVTAGVFATCCAKTGVSNTRPAKCIFAASKHLKIRKKFMTYVQVYLILKAFLHIRGLPKFFSH